MMRGLEQIDITNMLWWSFELVKPFWRILWNYRYMAIILHILFDPAIPPIAMSPKSIKEKGKGHICTKVFI